MIQIKFPWYDLRTTLLKEREVEHPSCILLTSSFEIGYLGTLDAGIVSWLRGRNRLLGPNSYQILLEVMCDSAWTMYGEDQIEVETTSCDPEESLLVL